MGITLLGTKVGMTRVFTDAGASVPVSVLAVGPCIVTQIRTPENDGYAAVQIAFGDVKPRNSTMAMIAHDAKAGTTPKRHHAEFRVSEKDLANYQVGQELTAKDLGGSLFVDVSATSKGKGFQGTMKRHNFKGFTASHGTERKHRAPGSIGSHCSNRGFGGGLKKGKKMSGHMGAERVTVRSVEVVRVEDDGLILVKGPVPGPNTGLIEIRPAVRLYRGKAKRAAAKAA